MKMKKTWIAALVFALVAATGVSTYAASPALRETVDNIIADVRTYDEGEMPAIPDGAVVLDKEVISEGEVRATLNTYAEGEMPAMPDGAERLQRTIVDE